ncbi:ABC transporter transmembrane domain-containing protein [Synechococcus sp. MU1617]|uniref:ABC transporter transmembrane domain-containing protein n=1 Tax=Synechococcus sp. MU1617 TaxID=2508346 RepID=UPI001CF8B748|nr:ABC transporter transmembrane domain-containing protein [Synechococcus sp. MU1617]MCB4389383.1 ATP-binding cassette domain-containing protein [Synechococcus sp. MU1617]
MASTDGRLSGHQQLVAQLRGSAPFNLLSDSECSSWLEPSKILNLSPGQTILSPNILQDRIYLLVTGSVRYLVNNEGVIETLAKRGSGQFLGWISLLRCVPTEWVSASEDSLVLALDSNIFISLYKSNSAFQAWFSRLNNVQESYAVAKAVLSLSPELIDGWQKNLLPMAENSISTVSSPGSPFVPPNNLDDNYIWFASTPNIPGLVVGQRILPNQFLASRNDFNLQYRIIGFPLKPGLGLSLDFVQSLNADSSPLEELNSSSLETLGITEADKQDHNDLFPVVRGRGAINETLAACEMLSLSLKIPFRRDTLKKVLESQFRRDKVLSLELLGGLCEILGLRTQLGSVTIDNFLGVEAPILLLLEGTAVILYKISGETAIIGHPRFGLVNYSLDELRSMLGNQIRFAVPRAISTTPNSRFGWSWFLPLVTKYRRSLVLVFASSLLAQLFGLAIPLLIQQIIDKVLTQGNMSSLNVIGSLMITLAVFQGVLLALRTYIFVDTTDRMDLTLGSAVIDRMLSLPLSFFEKRPVGELSQRLGELNSIRSFLTGTALVSVLNLIFAALYLVVMLMYSPLLTAVALSTFPLYALIVFGVAPFYRYLIKQRAIAQARTQSHLIEVLTGIQTVKAQHFELTARWKWQDRYKDFVSEGFKGVILGTTSGTVGSILNQISSLLVLWVGMYLVLQGDLTLGMLIAFRIIAGNVTGPLMQLSGLYQGFQKVQVSMERLSDVLDQNPETCTADTTSQIAMPAITGAVRFEDVKFRFGESGPYQLNSVSLSVDAGQFVGIVGQSGSGKSTLMKLLPRLYSPESGRIFIDNFDIGKVDISSLRRQIGIVPQDSLLFEGTIAENIALNDPQASDESIIEAAKIACAHDFIMTLGQGYATPLRERGSNLSGGQRQRIAIARTILANPQLLIMDEATSALDYNTEKQLCLNLQEWAVNRSVFFITHRISSIRNSDLIVVMHDGQIVEQGTHSDLIEKACRYYTLYRQQSD